MTRSADAPDCYEFWDHPELIQGFNRKNADSFFSSETYFLNKMDTTCIESVLDVGCSCGRFIELLSAQKIDAQYTGLDISEHSIHQCLKNYPNHTFILDNFLNWYTSSRFSLVNATGVVQHEKKYPDLIRKMIDISERYILFDVKIANTTQPVIDIHKCYCKYGEHKIEMICFNLDHLLSLLESIQNTGEVSIFGYITPPNKTTVGPESIINNWASCGVFIDKSKAFGIADIEIPEFFR